MRSEIGTNRRRFLKWMATTGIVASGSAAPAAGKSTNDLTAHDNVPHILPTPQQIENQESSFPITPVVSLVASSSVDPDALREVKSVLRTAGVRKIHQSNRSDQSHGPLTIFLGKPAKNSQVGDALDELNAEFPNDLSDGGYVLASGHEHGGEKVVLAGTDNTGTYHAVQTLRQLIIDHPGRKRLPSVTITDYPEMPERGAIEGFYGPPWSHEDRLRQLDFYGNYKVNTYIYSPKDDPYLRSKWRKPYPSDKLDDIKDLVDKAQQNHVKFTFALSPGLSVCYSSDDDLQAVIDKFESMYELGVRSFYIALDDISYTDWNCEQDKKKFGTGGAAAGKAQAYLLNRIQNEFVAAHDDVEPLEMVPTEYYNVAESPYKEVLRNKLDSEIVVQWTGTAVVSDDITQKQAEAANSVFGHEISIWDNYPVNDYSRDRLFLGPVTGRDPVLNQQGIIEFTANPMIEAESSKIPLTTVADYTWNSRAYDPAQSWKQTLHDFGDDEYDPLRTFAENTRSTPLKGSLSESPELAELIDDFWSAYDSDDIISKSEALKKEFTAIKQAPSKLREQMTNDAFLDEVEPWFKKAETTGTAGKLAVRMLNAQRSGDGATTWKLRQKLQNAVDQFKDNPKQYAPGVAEEFFNNTIDANNQWLGTGARTDPLTAIGSYGDHTPQRMIDNDLNTFYWSNSAPNPGDAFGVDLKRVFDLTNIDIKMANSSSQNDYVHHGTLEVSTNNKEWTALGEFSDQFEISITPSNKIKARYVRLRVTKSQNSWVIIRDFSVTSPDRVQLEASGNPPAAENSSFSSAIDQQPKTQYTATRPPHQGEAFEVTFSSSKTLERVTILQDNTKPVSGTVEVQLDEEWTVIGQLNGGYTTIATDSVETDRMRILWADSTTPPVLYEVIPQFENETGGDDDQVYDSLAAAFNADGISANDDATTGNFDDGFSYSAAELADAGLSPGATVTQDGVSFTWPNVASETNDPNEVVTNGQTIALSGQSDTLGFLGAAATSDPPASATGTVHYTDGSSESFTLSFNDWYIDEALEGNTKIATVPWTAPSNTSLDPNHNVSIYYVPISIDSGKAVEAVTLPSNKHLHIFAMALGKTTTPLSPIGDSQNAPTDPDSDGLYEDIDGDGEVTDADGEVFFDHIDDPEMQDSVEAFDFNENGRLDLDDIVEWRKKHN